jgi:hypothetical protein
MRREIAASLFLVVSFAASGLYACHCRISVLIMENESIARESDAWMVELAEIEIARDGRLTSAVWYYILWNSDNDKESRRGKYNFERRYATVMERY